MAINYPDISSAIRNMTSAVGCSSSDGASNISSRSEDDELKEAVIRFMKVGFPQVKENFFRQDASTFTR